MTQTVILGPLASDLNLCDINIINTNNQANILYLITLYTVISPFLAKFETTKHKLQNFIWRNLDVDMQP